MHSTEQSFFENQAGQLRVVLLLHVLDGGQDAVSLRGKADMNALKRLAHVGCYLKKLPRIAASTARGSERPFVRGSGRRVAAYGRLDSR